MSNELRRKDINALCTELQASFVVDDLGLGKAIGLQLTGMLEPCKACALVKSKKTGVSKLTLPCTLVKEKRLLIYLGSLSTASMGSKTQQLLTVKDSTDCARRYSLKEKSELNVMKLLLKDLKNMQSLCKVCSLW